MRMDLRRSDFLNVEAARLRCRKPGSPSAEPRSALVAMLDEHEMNRLPMYPPHAVVVGVADVEAAVGPNADAVRPVEPGLQGRSAVAAVTASRGTAAGHGLDFARLPLDSADRLVFGVDDRHVAARRDRNSLRPIEGRLKGRSAVARVALLART